MARGCDGGERNASAGAPSGAARSAARRGAVGWIHGVLLGASVWLWFTAAQAVEIQPAPRAPTISVLTFGPGDETFSKFGHDAIWVSDPRQPAERRDWVFNYGTFRFDSPWLIMDFLKGRLSYWLSVSSLDRTLAGYRSANRSVSAQQLDIPPDTARAITAFLYENAKPENAHYRYDYYRDNCATRIRDVIDRHVDGQLAVAARGPAQLTYRQHTRRLTVDSPFLYFGLDLAMGPLIDQPVTEWEEMFLPAKVEAGLAAATNARGVPLVKARRVLFEAQRPPARETAPGFGWGWLAIGVASGGVLYGLARVRRRWSEMTLAAGLGLFGGLGGILGSLLLVLWLLTDHDVTYWNHNVLCCPVWLLALPVLAYDYGRREPRRGIWMARLVGAATISTGVALLLQVSGLGRQDTVPALSVFFPMWLGAGLAVWERHQRPLPAWAKLPK